MSYMRLRIETGFRYMTTQVNQNNLLRRFHA
jgi:hypothetical protein